jgi:16S rRNA (uracil1498-N3)-methyltransferase
VEQVLMEGVTLTLEGPPANYLGNVLRLTAGAQVKLFDNVTGEWLAEIVEPGRKRVSLRLLWKLREREPVPDLWLLAAPLKRGRIDWLVEKATELGIARLVPVVTQRTVVDRLNPGRLFAHAIEAAEQCERTALPELAAPQKLEALLADWPSERRLIFADERGGAPMIETSTPPPADPHRPGRRLHGRRARRHSRAPAVAAGLARPAHPACRHRRRRRGLPVDGDGRRLGPLGSALKPAGTALRPRLEGRR